MLEYRAPYLKSGWGRLRSKKLHVFAFSIVLLLSFFKLSYIVEASTMTDFKIGIIIHHGRDGWVYEDIWKSINGLLDLWKIPHGYIENKSTTEFNFTASDFDGYSVVVIPDMYGLAAYFDSSQDDANLIKSLVSTKKFSLVVFDFAPTWAHSRIKPISELYGFNVSSSQLTYDSTFTPLIAPTSEINMTMGYSPYGLSSSYSTATVTNSTYGYNLLSLLGPSWGMEEQNCKKWQTILNCFIYSSPYKMLPILSEPHWVGRIDDIQCNNRTSIQLLLDFLARYPYAVWSHAIVAKVASENADFNHLDLYRQFGKFGDVVSHSWEHFEVESRNLTYEEQYGNYSLAKKYLIANYSSTQYQLTQVQPKNQWNNETVRALSELGFSEFSADPMRIHRAQYASLGMDVLRYKSVWCVGWLKNGSYMIYSVPWTWAMWAYDANSTELYLSISRYLRMGLAYCFATHGEGQFYVSPSQASALMTNMFNFLRENYPYIRYLSIHDYAEEMKKFEKLSVSSISIGSTQISINFTQGESSTLKYLTLLVFSTTQKTIEQVTIDGSNFYTFGNVGTHVTKQTFTCYVLLPQTIGATIIVTFGTPKTPHIDITTASIKELAYNNQVMNVTLAAASAEQCLLRVKCEAEGKPIYTLYKPYNLRFNYTHENNTSWSYDSSLKLLTLNLNHTVGDLKVEIVWAQVGFTIDPLMTVTTCVVAGVSGVVLAWWCCRRKKDRMPKI